MRLKLLIIVVSMSVLVCCKYREPVDTTNAIPISYVYSMKEADSIFSEILHNGDVIELLKFDLSYCDDQTEDFSDIRKLPYLMYLFDKFGNEEAGEYSYEILCNYNDSLALGYKVINIKQNVNE